MFQNQCFHLVSLKSALRAGPAPSSTASLLITSVCDTGFVSCFAETHLRKMKSCMSTCPGTNLQEGIERKKPPSLIRGGGWNGMTCLDSLRLCLPAEQPGFPNCSLVRGNTVHQTPGHEVQKWHPVKLYLPQLDGVQVQLCAMQEPIPD